jgi:hypothetical protein
LLATNDATELTPFFSQATKSASTFIFSQGKHITMACRALIFLLVIVAAVNAFLPVANNGGGGASKRSSSSIIIINTRLEFGFLKDLGLEKPSWLPDFGGKKEEDTTNDAPVATVIEGDDAPAAAAPEDDAAAPKDDDAAPKED